MSEGNLKIVVNSSNGHCLIIYINLTTAHLLEKGIRPEMYQPDLPCKINGKISFVETQGRENLYDILFERWQHAAFPIQSADNSTLAREQKLIGE
ncbi:MAG: hypothetical protein CM1200mP30_22240 [Pseudomonadota bacterium]|nr:MAG: hypothetical protein CM1200mP30_22240 [Pseudomonadota bacterium]